jgi:Carboxypeptidase regulatory-like domain
MSRWSMENVSKWASKVNRGFALTLIFCAMTVSGPMAHAQVIYGSITGNVQDKTGAMIPNAAVVITDQATGEVRSTTTNSSGEYHIVDLAPGPYTALSRETNHSENL